jgi:hypothetical protein
MRAILALIAMLQIVGHISGLDSADPDLQARYGDQLRPIIRHLAAS